ncbi:histidine kinase [Aquimarina sp. TRL1]|uniref:sensor histidine kinase n=1 Tax=Aquimarina sp. (strain TRL1) TaxID=2736252 RepID=UPI00158E179E|nr:sensor histidine kinase [Aquimarina sp. TRL1]QKX06614.1 histidine kinase [Aquimarina sp. TRL1]
MSKIDALIDNKIIQNIVVWIFLFLAMYIMIQADDKVSMTLGVIAFLCPPIYINNLLILPLFFKGRKVLASMLVIVNLLVFAAVGTYLTVYLSDTFEWRMFYNLIGILLLTFSFSSSIKIARDSFERRHQNKQAELELLKGQLNPHFLFNTLNNLYGLSVIKSDALPSLMLKLSDLLRYSLYETSEKLVPLAKEIHYLENYIALEKIRLEDKVKVDFHISGAADTVKIAPMLLIVFVENAFKYLGKNNKEEENVLIHLEISETSLIFRCENSIGTLKNEPEDLITKNKGIGVQNAKKRLALLYPNRHRLTNKETANQYSVCLTIEV